MSRKEVPRAGLVRAALGGKITNEEGAKALSVSVRQFRRLKARYRKGGGAALVHRLRGRPSNRRIDAGTRERVIALVKGLYVGLNDTHLTEKLHECEGLSLGRETVRRIRLSLRLPAKRPRRPPQHRARRLREARDGALVQIDGSPYAWLDDRGPAMTLVGAVDDATGQILGATFRPHEDLHGFATVLHQVFTTRGLPLALYGDGTSILVRTDAHWTLEEELHGEQSPTQLGRVLKDLGIRYIRARSPQAKGRIENRWGTLQDRLTVEMRLRRISSLLDANAFLPAFLQDFNTRFARDPRETTPAWRRPPRELPLILSCRYQRIVLPDNTVSLPAHSAVDQPRLLQIPPGPRRRSYARCRVELRELLDGRLVALYNGAAIASQPSSDGFVLLPRGHGPRRQKTPSAAAAAHAPVIPHRRRQPKRRHERGPQPSTHPWKRSFLAHHRRRSREDISIEQ